MHRHNLNAAALEERSYIFGDCFFPPGELQFDFGVAHMTKGQKLV